LKKAEQSQRFRSLSFILEVLAGAKPVSLEGSSAVHSAAALVLFLRDPSRHRFAMRLRVRDFGSFV
jgi:hypothetical protein